jgi:drug/metabolite transporter (DMT)-like permease
VRLQDAARLALLGAIWGASFIFMRTLAPVLGPALTAFSRVTIAGLALVLYLRAIGLESELSRHWREFVVIGVLSSALPFLLFSYAALHLPASYSAILNSATPLFGVLLSALWLAEPLTLARLAGLAAGMAGVGLVARVGPVVPDAKFALAVAAALAATLCYALSAIYVKRHAGGAKPMAIAGWSQVFAAVALAPLAPLSPVAGPVTAAVVANALALGLLCSAAAYLLYFRLIADIGPSRTLTVTFLIPVFGMIWSALFLGETITWPMVAGCALVIAGAILVVRTPKGGGTVAARGG